MDGFIVYRDGDKVVQVDDSTFKDKAVRLRSFSRYVTRARKGAVNLSPRSRI